MSDTLPLPPRRNLEQYKKLDWPQHVYWLGGAPCAGKTSISETLANRFNIDVYHVDDTFEGHARRFDPVLHPTLTKWRDASWNQRWMQPIDSLIKDVIACYREHFTMILEDVIFNPQDKSLLVDGTALLPRQVAPFLLNRRRAIWVIPTFVFQRAHYSNRQWAREIVAQCDNSELAFDNWMKRDAGFAHSVATEVEALNLKLLQVDGKHTIEENALLVADFFQLTKP
jgi:2-phosphoglycerate kinase